MAEKQRSTSSTRHPDQIALRLLQMLDAAEWAGFSPITYKQLHSFAYLGNLLSPLWDVDPLDGKILKQGFPYYPELRAAADRMIFSGLVELTSFWPERLLDGKWLAEGEVGLNTDLARPLLDEMDRFSTESRVRDFLKKLGLAVAPIADQLEVLVATDVTWTDNRTGRGDVIDFAEWRDANYTLNAAQSFEKEVPVGLRPSKGEKLQYYVHLLEMRAGL